jgi:hypothetical protein
MGACGPGSMDWAGFRISVFDNLSARLLGIYFVFPKEKAADNYIYPQLRYTLFDVVLLLWCLDGFVACCLSLWNAFPTRIVSKWVHWTIAIYFGLFTALILGGILMLVARSHGL